MGLVLSVHKFTVNTTELRAQNATPSIPIPTTPKPLPTPIRGKQFDVRKKFEPADLPLEHEKNFGSVPKVSDLGTTLDWNVVTPYSIFPIWIDATPTPKESDEYSVFRRVDDNELPLTKMPTFSPTFPQKKVAHKATVPFTLKRLVPSTLQTSTTKITTVPIGEQYVPILVNEENLSRKEDSNFDFVPTPNSESFESSTTRNDVEITEENTIETRTNLIETLTEKTMSDVANQDIEQKLESELFSLLDRIAQTYKKT